METPTKIDVMANQGRSPHHFISFFSQTSHYCKRALILKFALKLKAWFTAGSPCFPKLFYLVSVLQDFTEFTFGTFALHHQTTNGHVI